MKAEQKRAKRIQRKNGVPADVNPENSESPDGSDEDTDANSETNVEADPPV